MRLRCQSRTYALDRYEPLTQLYARTQRKPEAEHAASAIVRLVHAHPNELTIILLGPMTNLVRIQI